tara:strand:+ start:4186 stop:6993 length:2808 start_codon:yes stop_codon:yes gene_type:complete
MVKLSLYVTIVLSVVFVLVWFLRKTSPQWAGWCWRLGYLKVVILVLGVPSIGIPILSSPNTPSNTTQKTDYPTQSSVNHKRMTSTRTPVKKGVEYAEHGKRRREAKVSGALSNRLQRENIALGGWLWWHLSTFLFLIWGAVVLYQIAMQCLLLRNIRNLRRRSIPLKDESVFTVFAQLCEQMKVGRPPKVALVEELESPLITGVWSPVILLPMSVVSDCNVEEWRLIFAHELAHHAHGDLLWQWLPGIVQSCFFFHPLAYLANRSWMLHQELRADERALKECSDGLSLYGHLLLEFAQLQKRTERVFATFGAFRTFTMLRSRIAAMKHYDEISTQKHSTLFLLFALIATAGLFPWHLEAAQAPYPTRVKRVPEGWSVVGNPKGFEIGIDRKTYYDGHASAYIKRIQAATKGHRGFLGLRQHFRAAPYRGKRIRLSGYLKTSHPNSHAFVTLRVNDDHKRLTFGNTEFTVLRKGAKYHSGVVGKKGWKRHEIILDVPKHATNMMLTCFTFDGRGTLWCDAFRIEIVDKGIPVNNGWLKGFEGNMSSLRSPSFETSTHQLDHLSSWWLVGASRKTFSIGITERIRYHGRASAYIKPNNKRARGRVALCQQFSARRYLGKRIQIQAFVYNKGQGKSSLWGNVRSRRHRLLVRQSSRPLQAPHRWTKVSLQLDVPLRAASIRVGCQLNGVGPLYCDHVSVKIIGESRHQGEKTSADWRHPIFGHPFLQWVHSPGVGTPSSTVAYSERPQNMSFSKGVHRSRKGVFPMYWERWGMYPKDYLVGVSRKVYRTYPAGAFVRLKKKMKAGGFAQLLQFVSARYYRGKRVRLTGYIKSKDATTPWLVMGSSRRKKTLLYKRLIPDRAATRTGWVRTQIVLDIPRSADRLSFGCGLKGKGIVWCDDFVLEVVSRRVPLTGTSWRKYLYNASRKPIRNITFDQRSR